MDRQQRQRQLEQGHDRLTLKPPPGKAPYGYRRTPKQYVIDKATAPVVKAFFERFILSGCLRSSVRYLEQAYGKRVAVSTARRWLTHPVYRGDLLYQNQQVIADTHAPILSRSEGAQIDRLLRRNHSFARKTASAPRSLAGLVQCQQCQQPWSVAQVKPRSGQKQYLYLRPQQCPRSPRCKAVDYGQVLEEVIKQICQQLPSAVSQLGPSPLQQQMEQLKRAIASREELIEQLPQLTEQGLFDEPSRQLRCYNLKQEIAQLQRQLDQLPPDELRRIIPNVSLPQFWRDLSETERRFYFREFTHQIQMDRQPRQWQINLTFVFAPRPHPGPSPG